MGTTRIDDDSRAVQGQAPFKANKFRAFFVRTAFTLADRTKMTGWTMICVPPYELPDLSPTILTEDGPVDLTKLAKRPTQTDVERACKRIGKTITDIFPLDFQTDVAIPKGPAKGTVRGFLHTHYYEDDNGWARELHIVYQTADELDAAIRKFNEQEDARRAALKPSPDEAAVMNAARAGHTTKLKLLLAKGVNLNRGGIFDHEGYTRKNVTPLMLAAEAGKQHAIEALLDAGADIHLADDSNEPHVSGNTALGYACREAQIKAARVLLEAGADPNHRLSYGHTIFDESCYEGPLELIRLLLAHGADPNASCGRCDYFALKRAVAPNRLNLVQLLLDNGADIDGADDDGETPLIYASRLLRLEIVQLLLEKGANVAAQTLGKLTALHRVIVSLSDIKRDANKEAKNRFSEGMQIARALVENGANVDAKSKYGDTPRTLAKEYGFAELAAYFANKSIGQK